MEAALFISFLLLGAQLLRRQPTVDYQFGAGHERRLLRGQEQCPVGDVLRRSDALQHSALDGLFPASRVGPHLVPHRSVDGPRMYGVGSNALWPVLHRSRLGEQAHCPLRGAVGRARPAAHQTGGGGYVDNGAAPGLSHFRDGQLSCRGIRPWH